MGAKGEPKGRRGLIPIVGCPLGIAAPVCPVMFTEIVSLVTYSSLDR
jgi:hypothetical protein